MRDSAGASAPNPENRNPFLPPARHSVGVLPSSPAIITQARQTLGFTVKPKFCRLLLISNALRQTTKKKFCRLAGSAGFPTGLSRTMKPARTSSRPRSPRLDPGTSQSKTLRKIRDSSPARSVLDCASPAGAFRPLENLSKVQKPVARIRAVS